MVEPEVALGSLVEGPPALIRRVVAGDFDMGMGINGKLIVAVNIRAS